MEKLHQKSIEELHKMLVTRQLSSRELVDYYLARIEKYNPVLNAYVTVVGELAREKANSIDNAGITTSSPLLTGIPVAIKDSFLTHHIRTTAGSNVLRRYTGQYDSTVVRRLKEAGAIILGKTNLDEFSLGFTTETSIFGPSLNPWDINHLPGGSSGGSAAAVGSGLAPAAIGSEHYDSIRQPAAWCGVVGLKPTYGVVSRYGVIAMASSLECPGPIARSVKDAGIVLRQICGKDNRDANTVSSDNIKPFKGNKSEIKVGIPVRKVLADVDPEVMANFTKAVDVLKEMGLTIKVVELPSVERTSSIFEILYRVEVSSNLARYDGIRYGQETPEGKDVEEIYLESREKFGPLLKYQMMTDLRAVSSADFQMIYDEALKLRTYIKNNFDAIFKKVDVIASPTSPCLPYRKGFFSGGKYHGTEITDRYKPYVDLTAQLPALCGFPGISVPCGFSSGLPVGIQFFGPLFSENTLLEVASAYERETPWHKKLPENLS